MEDNDVPFVVFESAQARAERTVRRLWILCIILIIALLGTNAGWIWYESQFEYYEESYQEVSQETDNGGINKFIGGDYYGEADSKDAEK